jgi:hypothetical protein
MPSCFAIAASISSRHDDAGPSASLSRNIEERAYG